MPGRKPRPESVTRFADMFSALGAEPRLRITQLLLTAHPAGLVAGELQQELGISASTLSHHLEKLKSEGIVRVQREGNFQRYTADTAALRQLLEFLFAECCSRTGAVPAESIVTLRSC